MFDIEKLREKFETNLNIPVYEREEMLSDAQLLVDMQKYFLDNFETTDGELQFLVAINMESHINDIKEKLSEEEVKNFTKADAQRESFVALSKFAEKHGFPRAAEIAERANSLQTKMEYYESYGK